ncbi:Uncharacterized protein OS=Planctomyces limnophilus (strain ATCC 43296 / DSM 3776 / IFAM 1008 / 290) GN=Plim_3197 PE=4 SV=1 [Gemmata massiliana]|uniref:Uncharacterized protein n=1 Tax=Gemmata massiliana TaxID=1210884 RepID=A0A6P2DGS8_9BACT|nr:Uncharacterized protein OS=Planctomyces limnophilus (strain ATCC 43296 / DSM 3776 / IFAM 1008 / 290) GN=Plim_3197 PE=4 SV=1 [Gemmata massiliana]
MRCKNRLVAARELQPPGTSWPLYAVLALVGLVLTVWLVTSPYLRGVMRMLGSSARTTRSRSPSRSTIITLRPGQFPNTLMLGEQPPAADLRYGWGQSQNGSLEMLLGASERNVGEGCPAGPFSFAPGRLDDQCDVLHFWSHTPAVRILSSATGPFASSVTRQNRLSPH